MNEAKDETALSVEDIATSPAPDAVEEFEVAVKATKGGLLLLRNLAADKARRGIGTLMEGPRDLLNAQIFEDPSMNSRVSGAITRKSSRGSLIYFAIRNSAAVAVWGDRVLIKRDSMESAYSCRNCKGTGHSGTVCPSCKGATGGEPCRSCKVLGYAMETWRSSGFTPCAFCKASGWAGGIVIPEVAEIAPITGIVVSVGPEAVNLQLGDRVLHSKYAGHQQTTPEGEFYTITHEHEVLEIIKEL